MSFLVPLYIAGALAVGLPIVAHLLRRRPQGERPFGSLMFLSPSPPRFTRRSRLEDLLLLALRALALVLIALAFARPFFRDAGALEETESGARVALLLDTSASLQGEPWSEAVERAREVLDDAEAEDRVALFTFGRDLRTEIGFDERAGLGPSQRRALLRERLGDLVPTWESTDLASALTTLADLLDAGAEEGDDRPPGASRIVLISDLQRGSQIEALRAYSWPESIELEVIATGRSRGSNASLHPLRRVQPVRESDSEEDRPRVLVRNTDEGRELEIELRWIDPGGRASAGETHVLPPASSRVVRAPARPERATELVLEGDDFDFDNRLFLPVPATSTWDVLYVGRDGEGDDQGLRYYLERVLDEEGRPSVRLLVRAPEDPWQDVDLDRTPLVILGDPVAAELAAELPRYLEGGGLVLCVAGEPIGEAGDPPLEGLLDTLGLPLAVEPDRGDDGYAMIGEVDFDHPLFRPFADPRFGDFTKIRFWQHRELSPRGEASVVARFDDEAPFLIEKRIGSGRLFVMGCGWHPAESQLALSPKFPALMLGLLKLSPKLERLEPSYLVGDRIELPPAEAEAAATVFGPAGTEYPLESGSLTFIDTSRPGIYRARVGSSEHSLAINLDPSESEIEPLDRSELEQAGVRLGSAEQRSRQWQHRQRLHDVALEREQKLWQWLIAVAAVVLIVETWLAGRRRRTESSEVMT